jgi:peptide subunit release factor 1 (eRF1)
VQFALCRRVTTTNDALDEVLDRLAGFTSDSLPVVSLYLDLRPEERVSSKAFVETAARENPALTADFDKIRAYMKDEAKPSTRTLAVFSCSGEPALFEAIQLEGAIDGHRLYIDHEPHVFPLARLADQYSSYAALLVNTNSARLFVFSAGAAERQQTMRNKKGKRVSAGGWSQARYQRRAENLHQKHIKEVADAVDKIIEEDQVTKVLVSGDDVAMPLLRQHLSARARERLIEVDGLDLKAADADVFRATLDAFREADDHTDAGLVSQVLNAYRAHGLATIGEAGVKAALERGQVDRLLVPAIPAASAADQQSSGVDSAGTKEQRGQLDESTVENLVTLARRTDATVTFIEEAQLLKEAKGVGAILRFRL